MTEGAGRQQHGLPDGPAVRQAGHLPVRSGPGGPAILLGRGIGAVQAVIALVAGVSGLPYQQFLPWDLAAAVTWVVTVTAIGYLFGPPIARIVDRYALVLSLLAVALLGGWWLLRGRLQSRRRETAEAR